jgi:hypothetical protein
VLDACAVPLMAELRAWLEGPRRRIFGECDRAKEIPSMVEGGRFDHGAGRRPRLPAQQGCARPWPSARSTAAGGLRSSPSWSAPRERNGWDPQAYPRLLRDHMAAHPINRIGERAPRNLQPRPPTPVKHRSPQSSADAYEPGTHADLQARGRAEHALHWAEFRARPVRRLHAVAGARRSLLSPVC